MNHRAFLVAALALSLTAAHAAPVKVVSSALPPAITEASGIIPLIGLSGDKFLLIGDRDLGLTVIDGATAAFNSGHFAGHLHSLTDSLGDSLEVNDMEDAAWDAGRHAAFVIESGSKTSKNEIKAKREKLVRLTFDPKTGAVRGQEYPHFKDRVVAAFPQLQPSVESDSALGGAAGTFNIEGAALVPGGKLLLGFRSPTHGSDAIAITLTNPHALFDSNATPKFASTPQYLNLHGQGIRGMSYDAQRKGCWIVSGTSANGKDVKREPWKLWFWNLKTAPVEKAVPKNSMRNAEGVCRVNLGGKPGLLVMEDNGDDPCRYLVIGLPG